MPGSAMMHRDSFLEGKDTVLGPLWFMAFLLHTDPNRSNQKNRTHFWDSSHNPLIPQWHTDLNFQTKTSTHFFCVLFGIFITFGPLWYLTQLPETVSSLKDSICEHHSVWHPDICSQVLNKVLFSSSPKLTPRNKEQGDWNCYRKLQRKGKEKS